jgi:hypothetical protein
MRSNYEPPPTLRLACWFGTYFVAYLFLIWSWPGEFHDWTLPIDIPEGLLFLSFGLFGPQVDKYGGLVLFLSYGFYLVNLVLVLALPNKKIFWALMIGFIVVTCLSSFGTARYGGIIIGMLDRVKH